MIKIILQHNHPTLSLFIISIFILFNLKGQAQNLQCGSDYYNSKAIEQHPHLLQQINELENFTQEFTADQDPSRANVKVIPVVVHIMHNYGNENISKAQVLDAIRILNEDFNLLNQDQTSVIPEFQDRIANCQFEFRLAGKDPQGNCTDGITRTVTALTYSAGDNVKDLISWTTSRYLNIWVVDNIGIGAGGYAYRPGNAPQASYDGIVVNHRQFGSIGSSGGSNFAARTLTHEVGHYINLNHPWGASNNPGLASNCNSDDNVADTPNTIGVANQSCNLAQVTCNSLDNVQNFMDYSSCAIMFTNGQKTRMQAALASPIGSRNNLSSTSNLNFTGTNDGFVAECAPIADFRVVNSFACIGENLTFQDVSYNGDVVSWQWTFPGGTPSTSNLQNPVVAYENPGTYNATLTVSNSIGSNQKTKTQIVNVSPIVAATLAPLFEGMESSTFPVFPDEPLKNWIYESPSATPFTRVTNAVYSGNASLKYNDALPTGTISSMISPTFDLSDISGAKNVTFKVAYARRNTSSEDKLTVYVSRNCGKTWLPRYSKIGEALATVSANFSSGFTPSGQNQWRIETINLTAFANDNSLLLRFEVTDGGGNAIYLDDINIGESPLSIDKAELLRQNALIFPNPGAGNETLTFDVLTASKANITIFDAVGRMISSKNLGVLNQGNYQYSLAEFLPERTNGIYFVRIALDEHFVVLKWISQN